MSIVKELKGAHVALEARDKELSEAQAELATVRAQLDAAHAALETERAGIAAKVAEAEAAGAKVADGLRAEIAARVAELADLNAALLAVQDEAKANADRADKLTRALRDPAYADALAKGEEKPLKGDGVAGHDGDVSLLSRLAAITDPTERARFVRDNRKALKAEVAARR